MSLNGKKVLITGASQGLGRAIAKVFAQEKALVFVNFASSADKAKAVVEEIQKENGQAEIFQCDMSNEAEVNEKIANLEKQYGGIDVLINNARIDPYKRKAEMSDGEWWDKTMAVNLKGAYLPSLAVIDGMKKRKWGRIVNVSSIWASWGAKNRQMIPYSVSKAGMHSLSRALAVEGAPYNVTANTVAPGVIMTENIMNRLTDKQFEDEIAAVPLNRGGSPEEIAQVILNTVNSGFITGETINVNGGAFMGA